MSKSKFLKALLVFGMSVTTATAMFGMAACGAKDDDKKDDTNQDEENPGGNEGGGEEDEHTHHWVWKSDEEQHWKECDADGHTGNKVDSATLGDHVDADENGVCDECGRPGIPIPHKHVWDMEHWEYDPNGHWHPCLAEGHDPKDNDVQVHHDANHDGVCDDGCGYTKVLPEAYTTLLAKTTGEEAPSTLITAETFLENKAPAEFSNWGTAGIYQGRKSTGTPDVLYVEVSDNRANLVTTSAGATYLYIDFGDVSASVVEGYFELTNVVGTGNYTPIQFTSSEGGSDQERFGIRTEDGKYRLDGTGTINTTTPNYTSSWSLDGGYKVHFVYNSATNKMSVDIGGQVLVTDAQLSGGLSGIKLSSGDSNTSTYSVENIVIAKTAIDVSDYVNTVKTNVEALTASAEALRGDAWSLATTASAITDAKTTALSALEGTLSTTAEVDVIYDTFEAAIINALKAEYKDRLVKAYPEDNYGQTVGDPNGNGALYTAAMTKHNGLIDAVSDVSKFNGVYTAACEELDGIHTDEYYNKADVTLTISDGTNTQTIEGKEGDVVTEAQAKAKVTVPEGQKIEAFFTDEAYTEGNEVTFPLTVNSSMTIYAKLVVKTETVYTLNATDVPSSAPNADTLIGDFFTITTKVKSESAKMNSGTYTKQISLTGGKASTSANAIKFTVASEATIKIVAGAKSDKPTVKISVLDGTGATVTPTNIKLNGVDSAFENLPVANGTATAELAVTYTFTIPAGSYCIGGNGGGAYFYEFVVTV